MNKERKQNKKPSNSLSFWGTLHVVGKKPKILIEKFKWVKEILINSFHNKVKNVIKEN